MRSVWACNFSWKYSDTVPIFLQRAAGSGRSFLMEPIKKVFGAPNGRRYEVSPFSGPDYRSLEVEPAQCSRDPHGSRGEGERLEKLHRQAWSKQHFGYFRYIKTLILTLGYIRGNLRGRDLYSCVHRAAADTECSQKVKRAIWWC